jgi:hypothetical protein
MFSPIETTEETRLQVISFHNPVDAVQWTGSENVARRRGASRVPWMYPRCTRALPFKTTKNGHLQALVEAL